MGAPQGSFNFHIGLDGTVEVARTLRSMKADVQGLTNAWKAQEINLKSAGDSTKAAETRYKGLSEAVKSQKQVIAELKQEQSSLDVATTKGAQTFASLQRQVSQAEAKLAGMTQQQSRAKDSMKYYESGIASAQSELKKITSVSESYVKRLQAEGNQNQANTEKLRSLKEQYSQMSTIYSKQTSELERIGKESGKASDAYAKQAVRVNDLKAKMSGTATEMKQMTASSVSTNTHIAAMRDVAGKTGNGIKTAFNKAKGSIVGVGLAAAGAGAALVSGAKDASTLAHRYNETYNLIKLGGEKAADATKEVTQMQKDGANYSTKYGKSQQSIADAYQDLVKRGYTGKQALGAMKTELQASVASGDDFADVVNVSSQVLEAFGMRANSTAKMTANTKRAVNEVAFAADTTASSFSSLGKGMEFVGATAHTAGFSLTETSAALGILSNHSLEADKAGTGLQQVLVQLAKPSSRSVKVLDSIGLSPDDFKTANGNFKSLTDIMGILQQHTKDMGKADQAGVFKSLFGANGMRAAQILAQNNKQLGETITKVKQAGDSGDYVQKLAKKNGDDAQMSMSRFNQSANALQIMASAKLLPALSDAADAMTKGLASKGNQKVIGEIALGIGNMAKNAVEFVKYLMEHQTAVKVFAAAVASIWATGKIIKFMNQVKLAKSLLNDLPKSKAIDITANAVEGKSLGGALRSVRSAGGISGLSTAGKVATGAAGVGVAASSGLDIFKAFKDKNPDSKFKDAGSGIGKAIGGGIGLYFGGPAGAAIGAGIGGVIGKWGGNAVHSFTKGWGAAKKPKDWIGSLGFDARQGANGISKWWDGIQKQDAKNQKEFLREQQKSSAENKKAWNGFWKDTGKGWNSFWGTVGKSTNTGSKNIGKAVQSGSAATKKGFSAMGKNMLSGLHSMEASMKKYGLVGSFAHGLNQMATSQAKWIEKNGRSWSKGFQGFAASVKSNMRTAGNNFSSFINSTNKNWANFKKSFSKSWSQNWDAARDNIKDTFNDSKQNMSSWGASTNKWWAGYKKSFAKSWSDHWTTTKNTLVKSFNYSRTSIGNWGSSVNKWWSAFSKPFKKGWETMWSGLGRFVGSVFDGVRKDIKNSMNAIIGIINGATGGINGVIHAFGGKKETIGRIKRLATGTGAISGQRRPITTPTLAMLNDGPEPDNRELVMKASGESYMHQGRNIMDVLTPGDEVLNASETKMLFNASGIQHYASGTGVLNWMKGLLGGLEEKIKMVTNVVSHPIESFKDMVSNKMDMSKIMGDVPHALGEMMKSQTVKQAQKWWSTAWDEINDAINGGGEGGPWAHTPGAGWSVTSGFGHRGNVAGGYSTHDGVDFSGGSMVHAMHGGTVTRVGGAPAGWGGSRGIGESVVIRGNDGYSVIYQELNGKSNSGAHIDVKAGDVVKTGEAIASLGPNGTHVHVGVTKHPMFSIGGTSLAGWDDITKMHGTSDGTPKKKADKGLAALVHSELGSGVFKWIAKFLAPLTGGFGDAQGDYDPAMIKKAAAAMHVSPSASFIKALQATIQSESGGRNVIQQIHDRNSGGNEARGILQFTPGTFAAFAAPGHKNIMSPYDQLLAFFNNSDWLHSIGRTTIWGQSKIDWLHSGPQGHRRYANGGFADEPSTFGEDGLEAAIPMGAVRASRGYELLGKTAAAMATRDNLNGSDAKTDKKLDQVIALLTLLANQDPADTISAILGKIELDTDITLNREKVAKAIRPLLDTEVAKIMKKAGSGRSV